MTQSDVIGGIAAVPAQDETECWSKGDVFIVWLIGCVTILRNTTLGIPVPLPVYYGIWGVGAGWTLLRMPGKALQVNPAAAVLGLAAVCSIIANDIPEFFHPWLRLLGWGMVMFLTSNLLDSGYLRQFRLHLSRTFDWLLAAGVGVSLLSCAIPFLPQYYGSQLHGIFSQPMLCGPFAAITAIWALYQARLHGNRRWLWLGAACMATAAAMLAGSRGAVAGLICGVLFFIFFNTRKHLAMLQIAVLIGIAAATFSWWDDAAETLWKKTQAGLERSNSIFDSRTSKWEVQWEDFTEHPVLGNGFANSSDYFFLSMDNAGVEPGSGWIYVLASTGIFGGVCIAAMIFRLWAVFLHKSHDVNLETVFRMAVLAFFMIHLCIEGYIFFAGSPLCVLFWLTQGRCSDLLSSPSRSPEP